MNTKLFVFALALASLSACAQSPSRVAREAAAAPTTAASNEVEAGSGLTSQILYQFLLGEIAGQRGDLKLATEAYVDLAQKTRDARLARRATEIALFARETAQAVRMAELWSEIEPESAKARQTLSTLLLGSGRLAEAKPHLEAMLRMSDRPVADNFLQLHGLLARHKDKKAVLDLVSELAGAYPSVPESRLAVAQAALNAGQDAAALKALDEALRLKPGWESAALLRGQVLAREREAVALEYWQGFLEQYPSGDRVRLAYARALVREGRLQEARQQFERMLEAAPSNPETRFAIGLLAMQMNDLDAAEQNLELAREHGYPDEGLVLLYLGQLNEGRQRYDKALAWYAQVGNGEHYFQARLKMAVVLGKLQRVAEGRALLRELQADDEQDRSLIVQAEAQLLREARQYEEAFNVLSKALSEKPDSPDLLYDRAMIADKINRLDVLEADLRRVIALQPDHAHAYNALGYTLVDRTSRIAEGIVFLEKAQKLSPDDPFILDSMGWAHFKAHRYAEALDYLRRAYAHQPDPEIAAHLGETLWQMGLREEAQRIWDGALRDYPDNDYLRETLSRIHK